jgi:hypothetical protein
MTFTLSTIPKINPAIASTIVEAEAVVVNPQKGKVNVFNPVGTFIWENIDGQQSLKMIVAAVCDEFAVDSETAVTDALQFIASLVERDIVTLG